jgi:hypothetical protein
MNYIKNKFKNSRIVIISASVSLAGGYLYYLKNRSINNKPPTLINNQFDKKCDDIVNVYRVCILI